MDSHRFLLNQSSQMSPSNTYDSPASYRQSPESVRSSRSASLNSTFTRRSYTSASSIDSKASLHPSSVKLDLNVAHLLGYPTPPKQPVQNRASLSHPMMPEADIDGLDIQQRELRVGGERVVESSGDQIKLPMAHRLVGPARQHFVDGLVATSVKAIESIWKPEPPTNTEGVASNEKVLPLNWFIKEVLRRSRTSASVLQTGLYYLHRSRRTIRERIARAEEAAKKLDRHVSGPSSMSMDVDDDQELSRSEIDELLAIGHDPVLCGRRMFLAAIITASKFLQDRNYSNLAWSKISSLDVREININERAFLALLDYKLHIDADVFCKWSDQLMKLAQGAPVVMTHPSTLRRTQSENDEGVACTRTPLRKSPTTIPTTSKQGFSTISANVRAPYATPEEDEVQEEEETDEETDEESSPIDKGNATPATTSRSIRVPLWNGRLAAAAPSIRAPTLSEGRSSFQSGTCATEERASMSSFANFSSDYPIH